jgi:hypothetical protein
VFRKRTSKQEEIYFKNHFKLLKIKLTFKILKNSGGKLNIRLSRTQTEIESDDAQIDLANDCVASSVVVDIFRLLVVLVAFVLGARQEQLVGKVVHHLLHDSGLVLALKSTDLKKEFKI